MQIPKKSLRILGIPKSRYTHVNWVKRVLIYGSFITKFMVLFLFFIRVFYASSNHESSSIAMTSVRGSCWRASSSGRGSAVAALGWFASALDCFRALEETTNRERILLLRLIINRLLKRSAGRPPDSSEPIRRSKQRSKMPPEQTPAARRGIPSVVQSMCSVWTFSQKS